MSSENGFRFSDDLLSRIQSKNNRSIGFAHENHRQTYL